MRGGDLNTLTLHGLLKCPRQLPSGGAKSLRPTYMGPWQGMPLQMHGLKLELKAVAVHQPVNGRARLARDRRDHRAINGAARARQDIRGKLLRTVGYSLQALNLRTGGGDCSARSTGVAEDLRVALEYDSRGTTLASGERRAQASSPGTDDDNIRLRFEHCVSESNENTFGSAPSASLARHCPRIVVSFSETAGRHHVQNRPSDRSTSDCRRETLRAYVSATPWTMGFASANTHKPRLSRRRTLLPPRQTWPI